MAAISASRYSACRREVGQRHAAPLRVAQLSHECQHRSQVRDLDVVADVDPVPAQQVAQEGYLHGLLFDQIHDRLIQVALADAVIAGIMEPMVPP
jgi:hypothetical protein